MKIFVKILKVLFISTLYFYIRKPSGVENKTYRKTLSSKPIVEEKLRKTNTRLNKWAMNKIIKK